MCSFRVIDFDQHFPLVRRTQLVVFKVSALKRVDCILVRSHRNVLCMSPRLCDRNDNGIISVQVMKHWNLRHCVELS